MKRKWEEILTCWGRCAISTEGKLVLYSWQCPWRGHTTEHVRKEEGIVGNGVSIHVTWPSLWAGRVVTSHCLIVQPFGLAQTL